MKNPSPIRALMLLFVILAMFSCNRATRDVAQQTFLYDAANLANQHNGFYTKAGQVDVAAKDVEDQRELSITLHNAAASPKNIKIFQKKEAKSPDLKSGKYEVLFLRSALILNDPATGQSVEFIVKNEDFNALKAKLPTNYFNKNATEVIGIAIYGKPEVLAL
ncbi:hypothetical protein [Dyadobacter chenhuakuii]|uniref:Uncharacterized protein n=1 Tax=Dyadobacter chenhuakuii TaxID=2909339 RepID=A0ABY4XPT1_9BACT|nr:hypothetical protein [Dyadobacter chenhuakuii]MCF2493281.1 hypothetical protein [Dyadobacter chenhuakuii]USJ32437.1 hypothetical protein NFI80_06765 [Dyadobacter chenhuakuii]